MTNEEKIRTALELLRALKWDRESWLSNACRIDEVINVLQSRSSKPKSPVETLQPRSGLSDRLFALLGKRARDARGKTETQRKIKHERGS